MSKSHDLLSFRSLTSTYSFTSSDIYHTPVGVKSLERSLLFHVEATRGKVQGELKICKDSVWLWARDGTVYRKLLKADQPLKVQKLDVMPVIIASSPSGKYWAIYDGRKRNVQIWSEDSDNILHGAESEALEVSRIPKYLEWLDDEKVILADPVASIWVMSWNGEAGELDIVFSGRLSTKGIFALQRDDASSDNFWVGYKDSSVLYRICRIEGQASLQAVNTQCLHQGAVKEVSIPPVITCGCPKLSYRTGPSCFLSNGPTLSGVRQYKRACCQ